MGLPGAQRPHGGRTAARRVEETKTTLRSVTPMAVLGRFSTPPIDTRQGEWVTGPSTEQRVRRHPPSEGPGSAWGGVGADPRGGEHTRAAAVVGAARRSRGHHQPPPL